MYDQLQAGFDAPAGHRITMVEPVCCQNRGLPDSTIWLKVRTHVGWMTVVFGGCTILGTVGFVGLPLASPGAFRSAFSFFLLGLPYWYLWAMLVPVVVYVSRRYQIDADKWMKPVAVHSLMGVALSLVQLGGYASYAHILGLFTDVSYTVRLVDTVISWFHITFLVYWVIVAVIHAILYYRDSKQRATAAAELEMRLTEAQLRELRAQLHPHFLFNALHTVAGFVRDRRPADATNMIAELSELLRLSLDRNVTAEATLEEEMEFVSRYLRIQKARLRDRLQLDIAIPSDVLQARIPTMTLQTLVENAIRHGIAPCVDAGTLEVRAQRSGEMLRLTVSDDGLGFPDGKWLNTKNGIGLRNTRERLARLYGTKQSLHLSNHKRGGARVVVSIPWHTEASSDGISIQ